MLLTWDCHLLTLLRPFLTSQFRSSGRYSLSGCK